MITLAGLLLAFTAPAFADYSLHGQTTVIDQGRPRIHAPYSGANSLQADPESATSVTSTLFFGWRPFSATELYIDPELAGGKGISKALGIAGFTNGETFRVGDPTPTLYPARLFVQQTIGLGGGEEKLDDAPNQVAGGVPEERLILRAGKFGVADYFDNNAYSHDPRGQFLNWALMNSGAWDYPADVRGYTWGLIAEYRKPGAAVRGGAVAENFSANSQELDHRIGRAHGFMLEGEKAFALGGKNGTARLMGFFNEARMGSYNQTISNPADMTDVTRTRAYGRTKYGFTTSDDLALSDTLGAFARLSWSDGRNETWTYAEIDSSQALGLSWKAARLGRPQDVLGTAGVVNELSGPHRRYLADGGLGFMLGDGALHYGPEMIWETYYRVQANPWLQISPDAQLVVNPAYNRARGPVPVWAVRAHMEF